MAAQAAKPIEKWTANRRVALVVSILKGETSVEEVEDWRIPYLKAAFIECSYPNSMEELARASKHLTPTVLARPHSGLQDEAPASFAADWYAATNIIQESHELGANIVHKCSDVGASVQPGRFIRLTMVLVEGPPQVHTCRDRPTTRKLEVSCMIHAVVTNSTFQGRNGHGRSRHKLKLLKIAFPAYIVSSAR